MGWLCGLGNMPETIRLPGTKGSYPNRVKLSSSSLNGTDDQTRGHAGLLDVELVGTGTEKSKHTVGY